MRRPFALAVLAALPGCSNAPIAGFLDAVAPSYVAPAAAPGTKGPPTTEPPADTAGVLGPPVGPPK